MDLVLTLLAVFALFFFVFPVILTLLSFSGIKFLSKWIDRSSGCIVRIMVYTFMLTFIGIICAYPFVKYNKTVKEKTKKLQIINSMITKVKNSKYNFYIISTPIDKKFLKDGNHLYHLTGNEYLFLTSEPSVNNITINDKIIINPQYLIKVDKTDDLKILNDLDDTSLQKLKEDL